MNFTKLTKEEQLTILANAAAFVFKGGTSLSKGWGLIERFSEDIDLAIDPQYLGFTNIETKSQRTKLRKDSKKFIDGTFALDVENRLKEYGLSECCKVIVPETSVSDLDPVVLFVEYNSVLQTKMQYIPERVKVEISCRSLMEPSEQIEMRSMIEDAYPDEDFSLPIFAVPTVVPGRTFLEKVFLLHEEFNRPNGCTHIERITRHIFRIQYHFFLRKVLRLLCGTTISRCKSASFMLIRLLLMRLWRGYMSCRTDSGHWDGKTIIDGMAEYGGNPEAEKQPGKI